MAHQRLLREIKTLGAIIRKLKLGLSSALINTEGGTLDQRLMRIRLEPLNYPRTTYLEARKQQISNSLIGVRLFWRIGMTNIITLITPKGIFSNTRRVVPDPLKGASNENEIKAGARLI
jgi:hypothetical protein